MAERTVNPRQLEVRKWIVDACPGGVITGTTHKATAKALQSRRLAVVSRKGGVWRAEATDAGKHFVEHAQYPAGHWSTGAGRGSRSASPPLHDALVSGDRRRVTGHRPVDQLIADLVNAGGEMTVESDQDGYWEGLVSSANRHNKVPVGKVLTVQRGRTWKERVIRLEDPPAWMTANLDAIPVAEQLRRPHPTVNALQDQRDRLPVSSETRARALRILDAIAKTAMARGYGVVAPPVEPGYRYPKGHLRVTIRGHANTVDIEELSDLVPHDPTAKELRDKARYPLTHLPTHDHAPSGRLRLKLLGGWAVRQDVFADTKTIRLEDRLPVFLLEIELRAAGEEERVRRAEREHEELRREWQQVHEAAKIEARDDHRAKALIAQVEQWKQANEVDSYVRAMAARIEALEGKERTAAKEWLDWARGFRVRIDPLGQRLAMPPDPALTPDTLAPFMRGLPPFGPASR